MAWKYEKPWHPAKRSLQMLDYVGLEALGLSPDVATGMYQKADIPFQFAALNPHLHVVSVFYTEDGRRFVNRYCPDAEGFYLAQGVKDPNFEVDTKWMTAEEMEAFAQHLNEKFAKMAAEAGHSEDAALTGAAGQILSNMAKDRPLFERVKDRDSVVRRAKKTKKSQTSISAASKRQSRQ